jgi:hypothetical protein
MSWRFSPIISFTIRAAPLIPPIDPFLSTSKMLLILVSFILDALADSGYSTTAALPCGTPIHPVQKALSMEAHHTRPIAVQKDNLLH